MTLEKKAEEVNRFLNDQFNAYNVAYEYDSDRLSYTFRLLNDDKITIIKIARSYLDDAHNIYELLKSSDLVEFIEQNEGKHLYVNRVGITIREM